MTTTTCQTAAFDPEALVARLAQEGISAQVGPSAIARSPYVYVYVNLPGDQQVIISDLQEYEDQDGILVGLHVRGEVAEMVDVQTEDQAVAQVKGWV